MQSCAKLGEVSLQVKEGIVLAQRISNKGIQVYQAKFEMIENWSPFISVKGVRSFLGNAVFYRRFIKDFSKIVQPLCKLLEKETKFEFDDAFLKAFEGSKEKLISTPIIFH
ncbi:uncharacterized mitochondrial protein AtMg00860-like [Solanum tuberosum]|uniref:uncharacterized mitochondrial protein AtMg00860-like n=1 Tax=Solanum tuberosum TaxID=4113 RepID=UPI00073A3C22|nr:PREDICTED: uncharacterized mitochondrial protein AtMg00860-like [Solanum tuberosum]